MTSSAENANAVLTVQAETTVLNAANVSNVLNTCVYAATDAINAPISVKNATKSVQTARSMNCAASAVPAVTEWAVMIIFATTAVFVNSVWITSVSAAAKAAPTVLM